MGHDLLMVSCPFGNKNAANVLSFSPVADAPRSLIAKPSGKKEFDQPRIFKKLRDRGVADAGDDDDLHLAAEGQVTIVEELTVVCQGNELVGVAVDVQDRNCRLRNRF